MDYLDTQVNKDPPGKVGNAVSIIIVVPLLPKNDDKNQKVTE
jgi:hypothetical protein